MESLTHNSYIQYLNISNIQPIRGKPADCMGGRGIWEVLDNYYKRQVHNTLVGFSLLCE